ncbi:MAG: glycine/betaine ABC transporter substrate-binding protein [Anaerolineae bacterium]|nr:glycine/betaine ABC transporter substrate-binding protein [Anaerolineae bacterium]
MSKRKLSLFLSFIFVLIFGAACGGGAKETIALVENPWPASELNAAVAKIIIEQELGNTVEVIALDENAQWDALAAGDVDASLEVWPSGHSERITEYIGNLKSVVDGGRLGPVGEIGWYVPTYAVDANPALATWEGYKDAGAAFSSAETGDQGRFLGADPSWVQYDEQIIGNLGLPFQVVWAGSEDALLAEVSSAYSRNEPILFYFYSPHAIFQQFDLTQVELPTYTDECYADPAQIACAYPKDELMKIFSAKLEAKDGDVYTFLSNMNYGSDAQIEMLAKLNDGLTVEESAQAWVDAHQDVWRAWLP